MKRYFLRFIIVFISIILLSNVSIGESINIPNYSFELPETTIVNIDISSWEKSQKPLWYDESGGYYWNQLTGVFMNVDQNDPAHIDNCDGEQAAWLFAVPEVALYQELDDTFKAGYSYELGFGVLGGGGNMKDTVPIEIRLYYRDANDAKITIGSEEYTYDINDGYIKHFNDVWVTLPVVQKTDPWANKNIGIEIISTLTLADMDPETGRAGGYWDIDNVRLNQYLDAPVIPVDVPNYSFELPEASLGMNVNISSWEKSQKPLWYDESGGYYWNQLTGVFMNVDQNDPAHIDNCDGSQAAWFFALPEVSLYQDLEDIFEVGHCYDLGIGVIGGGSDMRDGSGIEIRLYYRDVNDTKITIDSKEYTYDVNDGYIKHLNDVWVTLPAVQETDPWANKCIGIEIITTLTMADLDPNTGRSGGYWDIDNVRLNQYLPSPVISVDVPNYSFELPEASLGISVNISSWQKSQKPLWYDESGGYYWDQLTGVFMNVNQNDPAYIDNCAGLQAAWFFALPEVSLYQDLEDVFEVGHCYDLGFGAIGGGSDMRDGSGIEIRLYYRDVNDTKITIDSEEYVYDVNDGYVKHFNDVWVTLSAVQETDPWANKCIGIQIISTLTLADLDPETGRSGGYWDIDNVRLITNMPDDNKDTLNVSVVP
ncbi:MAG: hypothetical protein JXA96_12325 [Sedimentisphaerales bacterium]|nr:hypothetical protein [Sedimentisphaerales bacterium]